MHNLEAYAHVERGSDDRAACPQGDAIVREECDVRRGKEDGGLKSYASCPRLGRFDALRQAARTGRRLVLEMLPNLGSNGSVEALAGECVERRGHVDVLHFVLGQHLADRVQIRERVVALEAWRAIPLATRKLEHLGVK